MKKRVLAALLALVMLFGALPMSVFAVDEDVVPYADELGTGEPTDVPSLTGSDNPMLTAYCTTNGHSHSSGSFSIRYNDLYGTAPSAAEYNSASGIWEYKVPVNKDAALERWKKDQPSSSVEHVLADNDPLYVVWAYESGTWTLKTNLVQLEIKAKDNSSGSTTPTGKPAALGTTHYFTINCNTPGCTAHDSTIFGYMYRKVETGDPYTYTIEFIPDKVNDDLKHSNHQLRETTTDLQIDPMSITWKWENGEWKGTSRACDDTGWPYNVYAFVESTASSSSTEAPTDAALSAGSFNIASVYCGYDVNDTTHDPYEMACTVNYIKGSFVENSAVKNANGTYTVKIKTAPYVDYFHQAYVRYNCPHKAKADTVPVTLAYTPDGRLSKWQVVTVNDKKQLADIPVYCEKAPDAPSITLTYDANAPEGKTVTNLPKPQTESGSSVVTFQLSWAIPVCEGYEFLGWTTTPNSNIATFPVEKLGTDEWVSTTGNPNYILYAVWKEVEVIPEPKEIVGTSNVKVFCLNPAAGQPNCNKIEYGASLAFKRTLTKDETNEKHYTLELNAEIYANAYTGNRGKGNESVAHNLYSSDTLTWDLYYKDGKWNAYPRETGVDDVVLVTHAPQKWEEVGKIATGTGVDTTCVTSGKYANYGLTVPFVYYGSNTKPYHDQVISVEYDEKTKSYDATFKVDTFADSIAKVCVNSQLAHKLTTKEELTWTFSVKSVEGTTASWKAEPKTADDAKVTVRCLTDVNAYITPVTSDGEDNLLNAGIELDAQTLGRIGLTTYGDDGRVLLGDFRSNTVAAADGDDYFGDEDSAFIANVVKDMLLDLMPASGIDEDKLLASGVLGRTDWTNVHIGAEEEDETYLNGNLRFYSVEFHPNAAGDTVENMPTAKYSVGALEYYDFYVEGEKIAKPTETPTRAGYTFTGWYTNANCTEAFDFDTAKVTGDVTLYAGWQSNTYPVNLVIYRNGDMTKAFKTVALDPQPKGTVINLDTLNIADYYKANYSGKYDFYGWYNDGKWNNYKANPENPPAGLQTITVNGWTNIICMVYDYEKVIVKAITDDNKTTETQLFSGMARRGSNLLDYLAAQNIELDKVGHTHDEWYKYDSPKWKFGENDTINGWTNVLVKYARKEYTVVAKMYLDGAPHYRQNTDFYTYQVTGLYGDLINFADIKAQAIAQAENDRPASASYDASVIEDWAGNATCTTFGEHQPDLEKHYVNVHVNTTQHVYVYRMIDGKMEATEYHHSTAPFGANVVEHLNANVTNLDMPGYSHDEWFKKDVPALDVKFGDTDTINGWTNVVIKYTKNEFPVTYDYACTDPALEPNWKVWETLPENSYTYAPGESVRVAMMPDDVEDGEYIWKFVTWKLNGVDVVPNAQVPMVEGGLTFVGIWERTQKEYGVTYDYACTDPTLVPNWKVWATLPENKDTYTVGQKVTTAAKPDDVEDGEYIWKFITWKLDDTEVAPNTQVEMVAGGLTFVGIWEHTQKEYGVTYSYDPSLPAEVQATIPKDPDTYTVGQKVTTAAKPNSVRVGENIWTFKTWKLDGVEVAPNTQVEMVSGGLHFEGIWETKLIHYSLTIQYVDKKGKELAESHMDLLSKGEAYKVDSPKIKGYKLKDKDKAVIEGTMPGRNLTIEVVYIKKSTGGSSGTIDSPNKPTTKAPALTLNTDDHFAFINGYPDGSVQPEGNVTRAETAAILYRIMGDACQSYYKTNSSSYSDVARGDWYNTYVATLENAGVIVDTRTNGKFRPNDAITRAELASMIAQFAGLESASAAKFNDVGSRYWAAEEIAIAAKMGWINGYPDGSFRPDRNVTRAELMAMVNRALGRTPKSEDDLLSGMKTWRDNANVNAWYYLDVQEATNDHTYTKSGTHETWKKLL